MTSWMKKIIGGATCVLLPLSLLAADMDQAAVLNKIEEMQRQIDALKAQLQTQQAQVSDMVDEAVETRGLAAAGAGGVFTAPEQIENVEVKGGLRIRYEYRTAECDDMDSDETETQKTRFRHKFTLGLKWKNPSESWEVAAGIATGSDEKCLYESRGECYDSDGCINSDKGGRSTNDSWNDESVWGNTNLYLDYLYAKHIHGPFSVTVGQMIMPLVATWIQFDSDLRPTGIATQYESDLFFVTLGAFNLVSDAGTGLAGANDDGDHPSNAYMYAAQVGLTLEMEPVSAMVAVGYQHYDKETNEYVFGADANDDDFDYQYQIGSVYAEAMSTVADVDLKVFGEYVQNFGVDSGDDNSHTQMSEMYCESSCSVSDYDAEDNDNAWIIGAEVKAFGFKLSYAYAEIEGDAVPFFLTDGDWGAALMGGYANNVEGHKIGLSYDLTKNCSLGVTAMLTDMVEECYDSEGADGEHYQLDLKYKF